MKRYAASHLRAMLALVLTCSYSYGQNLVLNPGFEEYTDCVTPFSIDTSRINPVSCPHWWTATQSNTYHSLYCNLRLNNSGWFASNSGDGYASIGLVKNSPPIFQHEDDRIFLQTRLASPLKAGCTYEVSFYARPFAKVRPGGAYFTGPIFTKGLGALLTVDRPNDYAGYSKMTEKVPQVQSQAYLKDTTQYQLVTGKIVAKGGEQYLTIGIFTPRWLLSCQTKDDSTISGQCNALINIDDVSVRAVPTGATYENLLPFDRAIIPGDTLRLFTGVPNTTWSTGYIGEGITISIPGKYWYTIKQPCFIYSDTINVISEELIIHIPNAFTPNNDGLNDNLEFGIYGVDQYHVYIYDRWGKMVYKQTGGPGIFKWNGHIYGKEATMGVYTLHIITEGKHGTQSTVEVIHLIR